MTASTFLARTAKERTSTIPIVFIGLADPVRDGLVTSLVRPGGNVTGISGQYSDLQAKTLQIIREALPRLSRLAVLWDPVNQASAAAWKDMQAIAKAGGVALVSVEIQRPADVEPALGAMSRERPTAARSPRRERVGPRIGSMPRCMVPICIVKKKAGALLTTADYDDMFRSGVLCGNPQRRETRRPARRAPTKFELVSNLKTAKASACDPATLLSGDQLSREPPELCQICDDSGALERVLITQRTMRKNFSFDSKIYAHYTDWGLV